MKIQAKSEKKSFVSFYVKGYHLIASIDNELVQEGISENDLAEIKTHVDEYGRVLLIMKSGEGIRGEVNSIDGIVGNSMWIALIKIGLIKGIDEELLDRALSAIKARNRALDDYRKTMEGVGMVSGVSDIKAPQLFFRLPGIPRELLSFEF